MLASIKYLQLLCVKKLSKLNHFFIFNSLNINIDNWIDKIKQKFKNNANYFSIENIKIIYMNNCTKNPTSKHLAPKLKNNTINKFTIVEKINNTLYAVYSNINKEHIL